MVQITEDLLRKRAEHNEGEIGTLEELSLHQQDIQKIENIDKWCKDLKILYLQSNLIPKIENVGRLKKLEYLNLALNNIEKIENVEDCESLQKLDLTVNFIGQLTDIECLRHLVHFKELYLTGNPCADYQGYREYVIATLQQLKSLDGSIIERSERILATQEYDNIKEGIIRQQADYASKQKLQIDREKVRKQKKELREKKNPGYDGRWYTDMNCGLSSDHTQLEVLEGDDKTFWEESVPYTPESRIEVHEQLQKERNKNQPEEKVPDKPVRRLFDDNGRPFNVNEAKIEFNFEDSPETNTYLLHLACYKHLDTSLIDTDAQPTYIRVIIKGKIFQLRLPEEINADLCSAQRSQVTGHLVVTMPKVKAMLVPKLSQNIIRQKQAQNQKPQRSDKVLEVDPSLSKKVNYQNIVNDQKTQKENYPVCNPQLGIFPEAKPNSKEFVDDPDVPPLI